MNFSTTLLREKFVIRDVRSENPGEPVIALSNRMALNLTDHRGNVIETFIVRSQTMHTCVRMAARIVQTFQREGPLMVRAEKFDFHAVWEDIIYDFERQFNEICWVAIYNSGKRIYSHNDFHAFLDVIENCDHKNTTGNYDTSVFLAEDIFAQKGKTVAIEHQAHTGMVLDIKKDRARCGLILRSPMRRNNFNFAAEKRGEVPINPAQCLNVGAAFLEGVNLAFMIGRANEKLRLHEIPKFGFEDKRADAGRKRMAKNNAEIKVLENSFHVTYRPERPEFPSIVLEAERYTHDGWVSEQQDKEQEEEKSAEI